MGYRRYRYRLHLFSFKSPALRAEMNEEGDADCAFSMRNGVKWSQRVMENTKIIF